MSEQIPTRHYSEDGARSGYVYLVVRDTCYSVKIGSTGWPPSERIAGTPTCSRSGFVIACMCSAMRELEYYLHTLYADVKLPGRDNFSLKVTDVMTLASWFDGGMWEGNHLSLADYSGRSPSSLAERGRLLGEAAKTVLFAEEMREFKDRLNQRDLREEL